MTDDTTIIEFARANRLKAAAVLVQIVEDETASPQSRQAAAEKILAYSDGRPGMARQITVADLQTMPDDLRMQLLEALLTHYMPGGFQALLKQACDEAVAKARALPRPNRFQRGPRANAPATEPPALNPPANGFSRDASAKPAAPAVATPKTPEATAGPANGTATPIGNLADKVAQGAPQPNNVVVLPGVARPFGLRYGLAEDLPTQASSKGNGGVHPDVVARSALKDPLAYDSRYGCVNPNPWRRR